MNKLIDASGKVRLPYFSTVVPTYVDKFTLRGSEATEEEQEVDKIGQYFREKSQNALEEGQKV